MNMPKMSSREVLRLICQQPRLKEVPVIILSTAISNEGELKMEGATECITKTSTFSGLCCVLRKLFKIDNPG